MAILEEFVPLFKGDYTICDLSGGRAGARSYHLTKHALVELISNSEMRGFFIRQVHSTIYSSMWQDFKDRIVEFEEEHGISLNGIIEVSDNKNGENIARNLLSGATIVTKGFKVSSSSQTASLKSLAGATHVYIEETEETEQESYRKLIMSLRKKGVKLKVIRAYNPPFEGHWLWKNDYELRKVSEKELVDLVMRSTDRSVKEIESKVRHNNKTYFLPTLTEKSKQAGMLCIQTNFVNNYANLNESALVSFDKMIDDDFHYYCTQILGLIPNEDGDIVYLDFKKDLNHSNREVKETDALHIGMDFNVTNMAAVVHITENGVKVAVDEFSKVYDTHTLCSLIKERYPKNKIIAYPDASGNNKKSNGLSDFDIIKGFNFTIKSPKKNGSVRDRVNLMNSEFRTLKYLVNTYNCPDYVECLTKQKYDKGEPDKKKGFDHMPDAGGYFIVNSNIKLMSVY